MEKTLQTKKFFEKYHQTMSRAIANGEEINEKLLSEFSSDPKHIEHVLFFSRSFPGFRYVPVEIIAAENKVFVRVNFQGKHKGQVGNIPPTLKEVDVLFALVYKIENDKIVEFSAIANEMDFFEQLGLSEKQVEVPIR